MARRFLGCELANHIDIEMEKIILTRMKAFTGAPFTQSMENMLTDVLLADSYNKQFQEFKDTNKQSISQEVF